MIIDPAQAGRVSTVVTIVGFCIVAALFRFGHNLHAAIDKRDRDEAEDREDGRLLGRIARSLDAMDEEKLAEVERWVG